jgi:AP-3 complex subunit delta
VRFVALLTFEIIVVSHPYLVSLHQDLILECVDDEDISIRIRALNLVTGMVNSDNLTSIVDKLLGQLLASPANPAAEILESDILESDPYASSEDEYGEEAAHRHESTNESPPPLPDDYRVKVIRSILDMCTRDTYSNLNDFEWYIDVLVKLVKACPMMKTEVTASAQDTFSEKDVSYEIGNELRNIAVRVKSMRPESTLAAQTLVLLENRDKLFPPFTNGGQGVLEACCWLVGEYTSELTDPRGVLSSILHSSTTQLSSTSLCVYLQAMLKVFSRLSNMDIQPWTSQRRAESTLLMSRVTYFLEPLTIHSDLEVQELAVEYLELIRLASEAASSQPVSENGESVDPPLLLTQVIPALFTGFELNPIASGAQHKVEIPSGLDLDTPINPDLEVILHNAEKDPMEVEHDAFEDFYNQIEEPSYVPEAAADRIDQAAKPELYSYQQTDDVTLARIKAERRQRNRDDPFYIADDSDTSASARLDKIIQNSNGEDLDLDSIPIMELNLEGPSVSQIAAEKTQAEEVERRRKAAQRKAIQIVGDETLGDEPASTSGQGSTRTSTPNPTAASRGKKSLLNIDSSGLGSLSLEGTRRHAPLDIEQRAEEEKALKEIEKLRLEMQRASERIQAKETAVVVKKKKKKKTATATATAAAADTATTEPDPMAEDIGAAEGNTVIKKKKKKSVEQSEEGTEAGPATKPKKKKRREINLTAPTE